MDNHHADDSKGILVQYLYLYYYLYLYQNHNQYHNQHQHSHKARVGKIKDKTPFAVRLITAWGYDQKMKAPNFRHTENTSTSPGLKNRG